MRTGIALGSNLGDRLAHLRQARDSVIALTDESEPVFCSGIYETAPIDCATGTPAFLNAVMEIDHPGPPADLLDLLQTIEQSMGRPQQRERNISRVIDLDLLYSGDSISQGDFVLPHPRLHLRRFVLAPLAEIAPERILPGQKVPIRELLAALTDSGDVVPIDIRL